MSAAGGVSGNGVRSHDLDEVSDALRHLDDELRKAIVQADQAAAERAATAAGSTARSIGGVAAKSAPSIRPAVGSEAGSVELGGPGYEFAVGAEFGALQYPQFKPWRGDGEDGGYFVAPALRRETASIENDYAEALERAAEKAGLT